MILVEFFHSLGASVVPATEPHEALDFLQAHGFYSYARSRFRSDGLLTCEEDSAFPVCPLWTESVALRCGSSVSENLSAVVTIELRSAGRGGSGNTSTRLEISACFR